MFVTRFLKQETYLSVKEKESEDCKYVQKVQAARTNETCDSRDITVNSVKFAASFACFTTSLWAERRGRRGRRGRIVKYFDQLRVKWRRV